MRTDELGPHPVSAVDGAANTFMRDVIGNKSDTIDGNSLLAFSKLIKTGHIISGTSPNTGGTANTSTRIELNGNASSVDGAYDPAEVRIISGTGSDQSRQIWEYDGTNKLAYINRDWKVVPDDTSVYCIVMNPGNTHVNEGLARGGTNNTITLNALASSQSNLYLGQLLFIVAGTGQDQARMVVGYDGGTKVATVDANWITNPDNTSIYAMLPYPGFVHGVATLDGSANVLARDVIGNRSDEHDTDTIQGFAHALFDHAHKAMDVFPTGADGVAITAGDAETWDLGDFVVVVPTNGITSDFDIHFAVVEVMSANATYELVLFSGTDGNEVEIAHVRFVRVTNQVRSVHIPLQTPIIPANTQIKAKLMTGSGNTDSATISLAYHLY